MCEPFVAALAERCMLTPPPIVPAKQSLDNRQTSAWTRRTPDIGKLATLQADEHFD